MSEIKELITELVKFSPRVGRGEEAVTQWVKEYLDSKGVEYKVQSFDNAVPIEEESRLLLDGQKIKSKAASFVSGEVESPKHQIMSSLLDLDGDGDSGSNINFNPESNGISVASYYRHPSLAFSRKDITKVLNAKEVEASVKVKKYEYKSQNILIGNLSKPSKIIFCHMDSIETGAVDNASGVAVCLEMVTKNPETLKNNLFVIAGNEELSYDFPTYWGLGYRMFQKEYGRLFETAVRLITVDCVGISKPIWYRGDMDLAKLGFPVNDLERFCPKIDLLACDLDDLMKVYHSDLDIPDIIDNVFLEEAFQQLHSELQ